MSLSFFICKMGAVNHGVFKQLLALTSPMNEGLQGLWELELGGNHGFVGCGLCPCCLEGWWGVHQPVGAIHRAIRGPPQAWRPYASKSRGSGGLSDVPSGRHSAPLG